MPRERSTVEFGPAETADDAPLRALFRETPMGGAIEVAFLREPSFLEAAAIQGTSVQVFVARAAGGIAGVATRAVRPSFVNGERVDAGYLSDLRIRSRHRGHTLLGRGYRYLRGLHEADGHVRVYSTVIVDGNRAALDTIAANRADLPRYTHLGRVLTPVIYLKRRLPDLDADIVRGTRALLPGIVAKLNENRLQFAPAYVEADFLSGRLRGFRVEDFYVLRRDGNICGVLGVWDQRAFRQTLVVRYRGPLGVCRPIVNLVRRPPLPPPGTELRFFYLAFISTDDIDAFCALLRRAHNDHIGGPYTHFTLGLHEKDPRLAVISDYARTPFAGHLFAVTFDGDPQLDGRVPYVEAALL
jgi:hypothetical protein